MKEFIKSVWLVWAVVSINRLNMIIDETKSCTSKEVFTMNDEKDKVPLAVPLKYCSVSLILYHTISF